ncbi:MAG TPA: hypothetical protein VJR89_08330, partial [Polyangiales bacterium]|nr:hypothetical protein [Polyangiales bacterium]
PAGGYAAPESGFAPAGGYAAPEAGLAPAQGYGPPAGFIAPPPGYGGSTLPGFTAPADPALSGYGAPFSEQVPGYAAPPAGAPSFGDAQPYAGPAPTYTAPSYAAGVPTFGNTLPATPDAAYAPPAEWFDASQVSEEPSQLTAAEGGLPRLEIPPPRIPDFVLGEALLPERAHDPHYYPGISDEEEPDAFEKPAPNWRRWAIFGGAGLAIFVAGMIARGTSGGSSNQGKAVIDVTPLDAQVTLDGEVLASGTSPRTREGLMHGEHVVQVERRGFLSQRRVFSLGENEGERRIVITLEPEPVVPPAAAAQPAAAAPAEPTPQPAAVAPSPEPEPSDKPLSAKELARQRRAERVAERYRERKAAASADGVDGKTARALARAEAKAAKAEARAAKAAARAEAKAAKASKGEAVASGGATALLKLNSTPWSEVYVDDRHVGHTPLLGLPLSAGSHKIRLVNPTLGGSKTFKIRLKAGQTLTKVVKL